MELPLRFWGLGVGAENEKEYYIILFCIAVALCDLLCICLDFFIIRL